MPFSAARATKSASPSRTVAITGPDAYSTASAISESACSSSWWTMTMVRFGSSRAISSAASRTDTANGITSWPSPSSVVRRPSSLLSSSSAISTRRFDSIPVCRKALEPPNPTR